jgi:hypothetical protein
MCYALFIDIYTHVLPSGRLTEMSTQTSPFSPPRKLPRFQEEQQPSPCNEANDSAQPDHIPEQQAAEAHTERQREGDYSAAIPSSSTPALHVPMANE